MRSGWILRHALNEFVMINGLIVPVSAVMDILEKKEAQLRKELGLEDEDFENEEKWVRYPISPT